MTIALEAARAAAQTDAAIDAAGALVEAARSYSDALSALARAAWRTGDDTAERIIRRGALRIPDARSLDAIDAATLLSAAGTPLAALLALAGDAAARGGERAAREIERCAGEVAGVG